MILVTHGGSGSTYVRAVKAPQVYRDVASCIDVDFKPKWWVEGNRCPIDDYNDNLRYRIGECLYHRTGWVGPVHGTIEGWLLEYMTGRRNDETTFSQFSFAAVFKFFSRNEFSDVVFLMRHPVDMAVSYIHPEVGTHGRSAKERGLDVTTIAGAKLLLLVWLRTVEEYRLLKEMGLKPKFVRFDRWEKDVKRLPKKQQRLFEGFHGTRTHRGVLPEVVEDFLAKAFEDNGIWEEIECES